MILSQERSFVNREEQQVKQRKKEQQIKQVMWKK